MVCPPQLCLLKLKFQGILGAGRQGVSQGAAATYTNSILILLLRSGWMTRGLPCPGWMISN